jgi:hypothetical protein
MSFTIDAAPVGSVMFMFGIVLGLISVFFFGIALGQHLLFFVLFWPVAWLFSGPEELP